MVNTLQAVQAVEYAAVWPLHRAGKLHSGIIVAPVGDFTCKLTHTIARNANRDGHTVWTIAMPWTDPRVSDWNTTGEDEDTEHQLVAAWQTVEGRERRQRRWEPGQRGLFIFADAGVLTGNPTTHRAALGLIRRRSGEWGVALVLVVDPLDYQPLGQGPCQRPNPTPTRDVHVDTTKGFNTIILDGRG